MILNLRFLFVSHLRSTSMSTFVSTLGYLHINIGKAITLSRLVGLCCLMTPGLIQDIRRHV